VKGIGTARSVIYSLVRDRSRSVALGQYILGRCNLGEVIAMIIDLRLPP
jgi:hypothetical protein